MRWSSLLSLAAVAALSPSPAFAQSIDLSWQTCSPIVVDWTAQPGATVSVIASVTGQSQPHKAYELWWIVGDAESRIPDAWRFDSGGCGAGLCEIAPQPLSGLAKSCPALVPTATQQVAISLFQLAPGGLGYPTSMGSGSIAVAYPSGSSATNPGSRYHAARFTFNFAYAVNGLGNGSSTCGGLERPLTLRLVRERVSWLDMNDMEHDWNVGNGMITVNGGTIANPASTWGQIKGQYRH